MSNRPLIEIINNNRHIAITPEPSSYSTSTTTMLDTGTSVSGKVLGSVVREAKTRVSLSWKFLTAREWAAINELFKNHECNISGATSNVVYFDQTLGDWVHQAREMIVSDRSAGMSRYDKYGKGVEGWYDCSLELTEV